MTNRSYCHPETNKTKSTPKVYYKKKKKQTVKRKDRKEIQVLLTATLHIALLSVPRVLCCDDLLRYSSHKERKALTQIPEQKSELTDQP